jgi:hypothetical protein
LFRRASSIASESNIVAGLGVSRAASPAGPARIGRAPGSRSMRRVVSIASPDLGKQAAVDAPPDPEAAYPGNSL